MKPTSLTAEAYAESKYDLPEAGRWTELTSGELITLDPPPPEHGTVVLNFSKALADHLQQFPEGYACYELGLIVERNPDTVYCPAISYFVGGKRFSELDNLVSETRPALVVEVVSTPDRRRMMRRRAQELVAWGVSVVIVIELRDNLVTVHSRHGDVQILGKDDEIEFNAAWRVETESFLQRFCVGVEDLFREPDWMRTQRRAT